jgi:hypothetical protein
MAFYKVNLLQRILEWHLLVLTELLVEKAVI